MKKLLRIFILILSSLILSLSIVPNLGLIEKKVYAADESVTASPNVERHTQDEIKAFVANHPVSFSKPNYDSTPSASAPYNPGKLSAETLTDGLNMVNQIRYIAGLSYDVSLYDDYNNYAQYASIVNAANGMISHFPPQPEGMDDAMYRIGYDGASHSNLTMGFGSVASYSIAGSIVYGYMYDGHAGNISMLGHRRWILNPYMGKTGFGIVQDAYGWDYSAMYAHDNSGSPRGTVSMWPAFNTPIEYFDSRYPWSYSTGSSEDINSVRVEVKNKTTGNTWNLFKDSSDGFFNVDNNGYALSGCIVFRPNNIATNSGDIYTVTITGLSNGQTIAYDVYFFSLDGPSTDNNGDNGQPSKEKIDEAIKELESEVDPDSDSVNMFRLYNEITGEHFYTSSKKEAKSLINSGWKYEGIAWEGPTESNTPVYRLYNPNVGEHHYTPNKNERDKLIKLGWNDEGIGWYSDDNEGTPLYRLYNPNATTGNHHYTTSTKERDKLVKIGWNDEGIGWYGY